MVDAPAATSGEVASLDEATVLVVDANPLAQSMIKAMLAPAVRSVSAVGDLSEATDALAAQPVDLVFADGTMLFAAGTDGVAALKRACGTARLVCALPAAQAADLPDLLARGADAVLLKPLSAAQLIARLGSALQPVENNAQIVAAA